MLHGLNIKGLELSLFLYIILTIASFNIVRRYLIAVNLPQNKSSFFQVDEQSQTCHMLVHMLGEQGVPY